MRQSLAQRAYTEIEHGNKGKRLVAILLIEPAIKYKFKVRRNTLKDRAFGRDVVRTGGRCFILARAPHARDSKLDPKA